ncbi:MAG: YerC/YecD family TrpR-related protein [bacterium]
MDWNNKENKQLIKMVLSLETADEAKRFLRDLLTENEIKEFANRIKVAELLSKGAIYSYIEETTGLSSRTIARVSKWLKGKEMGYKTVISKVHHHTPIKIRRGLS